MSHLETHLPSQHQNHSAEQFQASYEKPALKFISRWQVVTGSILDCALDPFNPACEVIE